MIPAKLSFLDEKYSIYPDGTITTSPSTVTQKHVNGAMYTRSFKPCTINYYIDSQGYKAANIKYRDGKWRTTRLHVLLAHAFLEPDATRTSVNHKDANRLNNDISNLEWTTPLENTRHAVSLGRNIYGSRHGCSKLKESDIPTIRKMLMAKASKSHIGRLYKVSATTIDHISKGILWKRA